MHALYNVPILGLLVALLQTKALAYDQCPPQQPSCTIQNPVAPSVTSTGNCGRQGTLHRPQYACEPCIHQSVSACQNLCASRADCRAFSFDPNSRECDIYSDSLARMDLDDDGPKGKIYWQKDCFQYSCRASSTPTSSTSSNNHSGSSSSLNSSSSSSRVTASSNSATCPPVHPASTVTITAPASATQFTITETKTLVRSITDTDSIIETVTDDINRTITRTVTNESGYTVTRTFVQTDSITKTIVTTDNAGHTTTATVVQTAVKTDSVIQTDFVSATVTATATATIKSTVVETTSVFATVTAIVTDAITSTVTDNVVSTDDIVSTITDNIISTTVTTSTVTVTSTASPAGQSIDINGCPAVQGSNVQGYVIYCGVTAGSENFAYATNPGYSIEDCCNQCFDDFDGVDCLATSFSGSTISIIDGHESAGTCTFYEFALNSTPQSGTALAVFDGL